MGILNRLLGKKYKNNQQNTLSTLNLFTPFFSGETNPRLNDTFMSCCQAHARHGSKFLPKIYKGEKAYDKHYINDLIQLRPNPIMNAPTFWEKITQQYFEINNVFLFLDYDFDDYKKPLKAIYPLDVTDNSIEPRMTEDGKIYIRFSLNGSVYTVPLWQIAHIARNVDTDEFFGTGNEAIKMVLRVMRTNYEGIEQAIKTSAFLRFVVQTATPMNDKALREKSEYFAEQYLGSNATGVAYIDGAQSVIKVDSQAKYANAEEMALFEDKIYSYQGVNKKIVQSSFTEDEWAAYYESSLEPLVLKIETELTYKLFTLEEYAKGKGLRVKIDANRLQAASLKTRAAMAAIIQRQPVYRPNTINELLFLAPSDHGDEEYANLNYVKAGEQSAYQGTKGKEEEDNDNTNNETDV